MAGTIVAAGTFVDSLGPVPEGYCWYVERITCYSNDTATTGVFELFVIRGDTPPGKPDISGRQDVATGSVVLNGVSDEESPIHVPPGYTLVGSWSGLTSAKVVSASFQIRWNELETHSAPRHHTQDHAAPLIVHPSQLEPHVSALTEV